MRTDRIKLCELSKSNDICEFSPVIQADTKDENDRYLALQSEEIITSFKIKAPMLALSCSTRVTSSAIWGHYADNSKGVCLAFDFPVTDFGEQDGIVTGKIVGDDTILFHKVLYEDARLVILARECRGNDEAVYRKIMSAISRKSTDWSYEKECRLIFLPEKTTSNVAVENGMYFALGLRKYLQGIIMGPRCDISNFYFKTLVKEIPQKKESNHLAEKLYNPKAVVRASLDSLSLRISVLHFEDYDYSTITADR